MIDPGRLVLGAGLVALAVRVACWFGVGAEVWRSRMPRGKRVIRYRCKVKQFETCRGFAPSPPLPPDLRGRSVILEVPRHVVQRMTPGRRARITIEFLDLPGDDPEEEQGRCDDEGTV